MTVYTDEREPSPHRRKPLRTDLAPSLFALNLFAMPIDTPAPSVPRPTSEDAADAQTKTKRNTDRARILRVVAFTSDGLTRDEIAERLTISPNTVRPRIWELGTLGYVRDDRLTRLTETGSSACVCEATEAGRKWLRDHPFDRPETSR